MDCALRGLPREGMGRLKLEEQGLYCRIELTAAYLPGLWRARLQGRRDSMLLGVLLPEGGQLRLCRRISLRQLQALGQLEEVLVQQEPEPEQQGQWQALSSPAAFFRSAYWRQAVSSRKGCLTRPGQPRLLALPYDGSGPFPLPELCCFARQQSIGGRPYLVFAFDGQEFPIFL